MPYTMIILSSATQLVDSLAWPVTALIIFWSLKSPISTVLLDLGRRLRKVSVSGTELDFSEAVQEAELVAREVLKPKVQVLTEAAPAQQNGTSWLEEKVEAAKRLPSQTVIAAFEDLNKDLSAYAKQVGVTTDVDTHGLVRHLERIGRLPDGTRTLYRDLAELRYKAEQSGNRPVESHDAMHYVLLVWELKQKLKTT